MRTASLGAFAALAALLLLSGCASTLEADLSAGGVERAEAFERLRERTVDEQLAAVDALDDEDVLVEIAARTVHPEVREAVVDRVRGRASLVRLATFSRAHGTVVQTKALARLSDPDALRAVAMARRAPEAVRRKAASRMGEDFESLEAARRREKDGAAALFVDGETGDDGNDGRSWTKAKRTIQAAVDAAKDGEEILVSDGVYAPFWAYGRNLVVRSENGPQSCIVDGRGEHVCATLGSESYGASEKKPRPVLIGLQLRNGRAKKAGGGAVGGVLVRCIVRNNRAVATTAGDFLKILKEDHPQSRTLNRPEDVLTQGGGAAGSRAISCLFEGNSADFGGGANDCRLYNCTFVANRSMHGAGAFGGEAWNCIFAKESSNVFSGAIGGLVQGTTLHACSADGTAVFLDRGDCHLDPDSSCIDAGDDSFLDPTYGDLDLDGNPRVRGKAVDMGCYETVSE